MRISKAAHLQRLLQLQDVVMTTGAYLFVVDTAWLFDFFHWDATAEHLLLAPVALLSAIAAANLLRSQLRFKSRTQQLLNHLQFIAVIVSGILLVSFIGNFEHVSRAAIVAFAGTLFVVLVINREFLNWYYFRGRREHENNFLKVLIIGSGNRAQKLAEAYCTRSDWGVTIIGALDDRQTTCAPLLKLVGTLRDVDEVLANEVVDEVVVCLPRSKINDLEHIVNACEQQGVTLKFMADFYDMDTKQVSLDQVNGFPILAFEPVAHDEGKLILKRLMDLVITIVLLPLLAPLFLVVSIVVKVTSPGPVFFIQNRVGLNKRTFPMIKFRSMYIDAEERMKDLEHLNEAEGPIFKIKNDPRITSIGRFIRKTSIDELPQLVNVLLGHMSLIGPRPMSMRDVQQFSMGVQRKRFSVKPGLACLREVSGRSELSFDRWLELDLKYIDEWSIGLDIHILVRILPAVLKGSGAS